MPRPRTIPEPQAIERALLLFWRRGFERTSISDLSEAIGVGPSSIYNAFHSKEELFRRALTQYMHTHLEFAGTLLADETQAHADEFAHDLLCGLVKLYTTKNLPPGCALFQSAGLSSPAESIACQITHGHKQAIQDAARKRFAACAKAGDELAASPRTLAQFVVGTARGLSQLACDGTSRKDLLKIVDHAAKSCVIGGK